MTYIAMLRGINVGGKKIIKMIELCASMEKLKFRNVRTYIQSGNLIFECPQSMEKQLSRKLEKQLLKDFGYTVPVWIRSSVALKKILRANPFLKANPKLETKHLHLSFLARKPTPAELKKLKENGEHSEEQYIVRGSEIYLYIPNGYGKTKLSNTYFEKGLASLTTTRNWNTLSTLVKLASEKS